MSPVSPILSQEALVVILVIVALIVAVVARRLRVPYTLALVLAGLALGIFRALPGLHIEPDLVLFLFLPALLFEGAWNMDTRTLRDNWIAVFLLAVPGLLLSLVIVAAIAHWGAGIAILPALVLGAIVSPTDPVAVLSLLRQIGLPERLCTIIEGESLFNDGVGTVAYVLVVGALEASLHISGPLTGLSAALVALKAVWLMIGGPLLGLALGLLVSRLVRAVNDALLETTVTFSVAYSAFILAEILGTSGLLAVVVAGLVLGSYGRNVGMSERTAEVVDTVWAFTAYLANSLLFLVLGVAIGANGLGPALPVIAWVVVGVLVGRAVMIYTLLPLHDAFVRWREGRRGGEGRPVGLAPVFPVWRPLILLSGLRGALSLVLVLDLPPEIPQRDLLRLAVYGVVLVTLVGQGIGLRILLPHWPKAPATPTQR
jgi:CPA1 family monovalent cation:H+ antiporter